MKMDRNQVIGFVLLALLLFGYFYINSKNQREYQVAKGQYEDSVARVQYIRDSIVNAEELAKNPVANNDSLGINGDSTQIATPAVTQEEFIDIENEFLSIRFTNKGGQPATVTLKNYKKTDSSLVTLNAQAFDKISYTINGLNNRSTAIGTQLFNTPVIERNADGASVVTYKLPVGENVITHQFTVPATGYLIDWNVQFNGADQLLSQGAFNIVWQQQPRQLESDVKYERRNATICFYENNDFDYIMTKTDKTFEGNVTWVGVNQQFFNTTLIAQTPFQSGNVVWNKNLQDTGSRIADVTTSLQAKLPIGQVAAFPMQLYFGPTDYNILKQYPNELDKMVNLGRDIYAFVRPINKYIVMPVFNFFGSFIGSMGLVVAFLTIFIRLLTSPLIYTSYLSSAKMKALRPEIEKLKEKYGADQQTIGVEQMKLFREAGVNPLGGCIPALLQIPIFFALYSFFNSNIALRFESFLWSDNLASYDAIIHFPVNIPLLGDHLSLFTVLAVVTSLLISVYSMSMTPDTGNPMMKYMPYIFPIVLLFVFNELPSALTWYYTVSNLITLILQFIINNYIIDHDKILAKIETNRSKPKTKSKWQERLEQMQEQQRQMQQQQKKK
ncbi:membrane protein insertase YidC [Gynurincola endophyticus]|uniref:membrane protein insertase YidC n=1 Tax=Gynurincola endophyticus TaxID=2479004 RepID=UPI000F8D95AA|nr:membrane protein insertase YidC [Gynurincola endophyticus]